MSETGQAAVRHQSKNGRLSVSVPVIQQAKIQAQVLVPLVKALQAELGKERANSLVRGAWGASIVATANNWRANNEKNLGNIMASRPRHTPSKTLSSIDDRVVDRCFEIMLRDAGAELYRELGEPEPDSAGLQCGLHCGRGIWS